MLHCFLDTALACSTSEISAKVVTDLAYIVVSELASGLWKHWKSDDKLFRHI